MPKKIKAGELTLNQIVEIAKKNKESCCKCPLYNINFISCWTLCEANIKQQTKIKEELEKEIEVEEDGQ